MLWMSHSAEELKKAVIRVVPKFIKANGPAIWGGCVTRREHRAGSLYPAPAGPESCHGARRVWHVFLLSWYKFYCMLARSRYNFDQSPKFITGYKVVCGHWRSVAVQVVSELESYHGAELQWCADERVRVPPVLQSCIGSRSKCKNRDKQLTHIVRVIFRPGLKFSFLFNLSH